MRVHILLALWTLMMLPRVLQRPNNKRLRTRILSFNCRTLLDDERLSELDSALTKKGIDMCALQETLRDGFFVVPTENYFVYTFGECSGSLGVGFAIHKRLAHLVTAARGIPDTKGRIMQIDVCYITQPIQQQYYVHTLQRTPPLLQNAINSILNLLSYVLETAGSLGTSMLVLEEEFLLMIMLSVVFQQLLLVRGLSKMTFHLMIMVLLY